MVKVSGNVKIVFDAYIREKCIDSRKTKTVMTPRILREFSREI